MCVASYGRGQDGSLVESAFLDKIRDQKSGRESVSSCFKRAAMLCGGSIPMVLQKA